MQAIKLISLDTMKTMADIYTQIVCGNLISTDVYDNCIFTINQLFIFIKSAPANIQF